MMRTFLRRFFASEIEGAKLSGFIEGYAAGVRAGQRLPSYLDIAAQIPEKHLRTYESMLNKL